MQIYWTNKNSIITARRIVVLLVVEFRCLCSQNQGHKERTTANNMNNYCFFSLLRALPQLPTICSSFIVHLSLESSKEDDDNDDDDTD